MLPYLALLLVFLLVALSYSLSYSLSCLPYFLSRYPDFLDTFDQYDKGIKRADAVRYHILHQYGGVYMDLDFEALQVGRWSQRWCSR